MLASVRGCPPSRVTLRWASTIARRLTQGARRWMERETGIEPATNSLEGCDSTTELLPPSRLAFFTASPRRRGRPAFRFFVLVRLAFQLALVRVCDQALRLASLAPFDFAHGAPSIVEGLSAFDVGPRWTHHHHRPAPFDFAHGPRASVEGQGRVEWWRGKDSNLRSR